MPEELRLGILCGSTMARWEAEVLRQALAVEGVRPVVVITRPDEPDTKRRAKHLLWHWYVRKRLSSGALAQEKLPSQLDHVPRSGDQDLAGTMREHAPDVLLCFGSTGLTGDLPALPKHGVWSMHPGDPVHHPGKIPGFWEIHRDEPVLGMALLRLGGANGKDRILRQGWFRAAGLSLPSALENAFTATSAWVAQLCRELLSGHAEAAHGDLFETAERMPGMPDNLDMLSFLANHWKVARPAKDEWNIGVLYSPITSLLAERPSLNVRWLPAPGPGQSRQCPTGHVADGRLNVLYGKLDATGNSVISRLRPKRDNVLKRSRTLLEDGNSYRRPYAFRHEDRIHVVLENTAGRVDLFRMNDADNGLEHARTLLNEPLCAPTLFEHQGRWWLFGTRTPLEDCALHIYHAPGIEGPWTPHALNPVKMDVRSARPAGTPFLHEGELFRPAADDSEGTGRRVALMRVLELTPNNFREELVRTIGPLKGSAWSHGLGTLSAVDGMTLVDGRRPMPAAQVGRTRKSRSERSPKHHGRSRDHDEDPDDEDDD